MKKQYILLVDDDPDEFEFFQDALEKLPGQFDCGYAASAEAAFLLLGNITPDYIFMDMNMPAINGLECMAMLKKMKWLKDVPVYIYTTGYDEALHRLALEKGASGCLKKPSQPKLLLQMLRNLYEKGIPAY